MENLKIPKVIAGRAFRKALQREIMTRQWNMDV